MSYPFCKIFPENSGDVIDIPASFVEHNASLHAYKTCKRSTVYVKALPHIATASELFVEPVTTEDWEMLQLDAVSLEEGRFLQQISVVFKDQKLDLWLTSGAKVSVTVLPRNFEESRDTVWPKDKMERYSYLCLRVLANSRIVIEPKPRKVAPNEYPLRIVPTLQDFSLTDPSTLKLAQLLKVNLVSVTERAIMVHPKTLRRLRGCDTMDAKPSEFIAFVQASVTAPIADDDDDNVRKPFAVSVAVSVDVPEDCVGKNDFFLALLLMSLFVVFNEEHIPC
jgi:Peroxisome biogenesis factor 1, N-terminal